MTSITPGHAGALPSHLASMSLNGPSGVRPSTQINTAGGLTLDNTGHRLPSREMGGSSSNGNGSSYLGYELKRAKPKPGKEPTWADARRIQLPWSSAELQRMVKRQQQKKQKTSTPDTYKRLKPNIKYQVDSLRADLDGDVNFEWTLASLDTKYIAEGSIEVILERQFRRVPVTVASTSSPVTSSQNQLNFSLPGQQGASRNATAPLNSQHGHRPMNADNFAQKAPANNGPIMNMPPPPPPPPAPMIPLHGLQQQSQQFRPAMPPQQKPAMDSSSPVIEVFPGFDTQQHSRVPPPPQPPQPRMPPQQHQGPSSSFPPTTLPNSGPNPILGIPSAGPTTRSNQMPSGGPNSLQSPLAAPTKHQQPQPQYRPEQFKPEGPRYGQQQDPRGFPPPPPPPEFMQQQRLGPKELPTGKHSQAYSAEPLPKMRDFKSGKGDGEIGWPQGNSKLREHQFDVDDDDDDDGDDDDEIILTDCSADEESIFTSSSRSSDRTSDLPSSGDFHGSMSPDKFSKGRMPGSPSNRVHREHRKQNSSDMFGPPRDLDQRPRRNSFVESDRDDHGRPKRDRVSRREGRGSRQSRRKSPAEDAHCGRRHRHKDLTAYMLEPTRRRSERDYCDEDGVPNYVTPSRRNDWILDHRHGDSIDAGSSYSSDLYLDEEIPGGDFRCPRARQNPFVYAERESPRHRERRRREFEDIPTTSRAYRPTLRSHLPWPHEGSQMQRRMSLRDRDYSIDDLYNTRRSQLRRR